MRRPGQRFVLLLVAATALACATRLAPPDPGLEEIDSLRDELADQALVNLMTLTKRLSRVTGPIRKKNTELCGDEVAAYLGLQAVWSSQGDPSPLGMAWQRYGVGAELTVVAVEPDSPAARAGIERGDSMLALNGRRLDRTVSLWDLLRDEPDRAASIRARKSDGTDLDVTLEYTPACGFVAQVEMSDLLQTHPGPRFGNLIVVTSGMIDFVEDDDELAILVAHELAHSVHDRDMRRFARDELLADRYGLYMAARAGHDVSPAPGLWARIAAEKPHDIVFNKEIGLKDRPHGRIAERIVEMRKVIREIDAKLERGEPLAL